MTERLGNGDHQRGVARLTLAALLAVVLLFGTGAMTTALREASAQAQPTPTGTRSTTGGGNMSPSPQASPAGTQIQFLNPSKYAPEEIISNKTDRDTTYHLVAWVSDPPTNASVEFQIQSGSAPPERIGIAERAAVDTFEFDWDLKVGQEPNRQDVPNGNYTLRAVLFGGASSPSPSPSPSPGAQTAMSTDTESVEIDRNAETVEILDPPNPGRIGLYDPDFPDNPGGGGNRLPGFTVEVQTSAGAGQVELEYTTAAPGAEPSWTTCQNQVDLEYSNRTRRIGCTVPESVTHSSITGLAAWVVRRTAGSGQSPGGVCTPPVCTPPSEEVHSGDAHRLTGNYEADPRRLVLTDESDGNATRNTCHQMIATVFDQHDRRIWRANVDVHAAGPGEGLQFATTQRTSPSKNPEGGDHERTEPLWNCQTNTGHTSELQGVHQRSGPSPDGDDNKHIESEPTGGTDPAGEFIFALRSANFSPPPTEVVAWADEDDDDVNDPDASGAQTDPQDPQARRAITWVAPSPQSPASASDSASQPSTSPSASSPASPAGPALNCEPETRTNPTTTGHTFTCTVTGAGASGARVDVELTGANDADGDTPTSPDRECTTNQSGACTFTHGPGGFGSTTNPGTTVYRAWIDADNSNANVEADRTEGVNEVQQPGEGPGEPDTTDVVEKTWVRAPLDCTPEQDGNPTGTSHTITCRASQTGGGAQPQGTRIVAEATGANDPDGTESFDTPDFECRTNQAGECSFTHGPGPGGVGSTNVEGTTRYRVWIDVDNSNSTTEADRTESRDETAPGGGGSIADPDQTDVVEKTWTRNPTALTIEPENDAASVGSCNAFTITVTANNQPVSGLLVDVEQRHERANNQTNNDEPRVTFCTPGGTEGPNPSAVDQTQGDLDPPDENPDNPGTLGAETLTPTDAQGRVTIGIAVEPANGSDGTGNVAVTAFFETDDDDDPETGEPQDTSTKTWVFPEGRTIVCEPENDSNPINTQHTVTCTVRDRFGVPVRGEGVTFTEDGQGDFTSRGTTTDDNGQVSAVTTSSQPGSQTITATIDDDLQGGEPGEVDECDRPEGSPAQAPAGACSDIVTNTWTSASSAPTQFERDVTIEAQKAQLVFGKNVTLGGTVESAATAPTACTQFVSVDILRDVVGGASEFQHFASVQSDSNGAFSYDFRADRSANYVAQVDEVAQCGAATSDTEPVLVKVKVGLRLSDSTVRRGERVRLTVRTLPCPATARDRVLLFRAIDGEFGKVGSKRTNDRCTKSFRRRVKTDSVFQARWPKQAEELLAGKSRSKIVRIVGR